jgi:hypothetical protein
MYHMILYAENGVKFSNMFYMRIIITIFIQFTNRFGKVIFHVEQYKIHNVIIHFISYEICSGMHLKRVHYLIINRMIY